MLIKPIRESDMSIKPIRKGDMSIKPIRKGNMSVKPINISNSNTSFGAAIKPSKALGKGFEGALCLIESPMQKDVNLAKNFYDSVRTIQRTKKCEGFFLDTVEHYGKKLPLINDKCYYGREYSFPNVLDSYVAMEGCIQFADGLKEKTPTTTLDIMKNRIEELTKELDVLQEDYRCMLKTKLEQLKVNIF